MIYVFILFFCTFTKSMNKCGWLYMKKFKEKFCLLMNFLFVSLPPFRWMKLLLLSIFPLPRLLGLTQKNRMSTAGLSPSVILSVPLERASLLTWCTSSGRQVINYSLKKKKIISHNKLCFKQAKRRKVRCRLCLYRWWSGHRHRPGKVLTDEEGSTGFLWNKCLTETLFTCMRSNLVGAQSKASLMTKNNS